MSRGAAILPDTRNMPFGMGDWTILVVGLCMLFYICLVKFSIDGLDSLHYVGEKMRDVQMICLSSIGVKVE